MRLFNNMKDIETFIFEQEFDEHFLIEEGFMEWIAKIGKKFWDWLTKKDFTGDNVDWNVGKNKKLKWLKSDSNKMLAIPKNKGLKENFSKTSDIITEYKDKLILYQAYNGSKTPIIMMLLTENKEIINKTLKRESKYNENKNKIENAENLAMFISIEIAKGNKDDDYDLFDDYIIKEINDELLKNYDFILLNKRSLRTYYNWLIKEYSIDKNFPVIEGDDAYWKDVDNEHHEKTEEKPEDDEQAKEKKPEDDEQAKEKKPEDDKKDNNKSEENNNKQNDKQENTFDIEDLTFTYSTDEKEIKDVIKDEYDEDDIYILINDIKDNDSSPTAKGLKKCITSKEFIEKVKNILNIKNEKSIQVCFKIDKNKIDKTNKDDPYKRILNSFDNFSDESWSDFDDVEGDISFSNKKDKIEGLFIMTISKEVVNESLDIDNMFWMLDTWFSNNEQERSTFMSIIDNCLVKKTYSKNDLAKLCDTINFEIRPFVNFMCKDAVVEKGKREDPNIDYYYELKKIIDALISNKSTANRYVRGS